MPTRKTTPRKTTKGSRPGAPRTPGAALEGLSLRDDQLLTTRQAAALVGRSQKTLRELRCNRSGPRVLKMGTGRQARCLYRRSDLERWIVSSATVIGGDA